MFLCKDAQPASSSLADGKYFLQLIKKKKKSPQDCFIVPYMIYITETVL